MEAVIANFISTEIEWMPLNNINIKKEKQESTIEFLEALEDDDDVQSVYSNVSFGEN